jgi:cation:H+ antiporter
MPTLLAIPLFVASLAVALASSAFFAGTLDRLGVRVGLPEVLLGLLTALAADGPEITSAIVALVKGATGVSLGVVVGSNVFNLGAMFGLTAVLAGGIRVRRGTLAIEGTVALLVTMIAAAVVFDVVPAAAGVALIVCVVVPYLILLAGGPLLARWLPFSAKTDRGLARALGEREHWGHHQKVEEADAWRLLALIVAAVALVVLGSTGMVETALTLADRWAIPRTLAAVLVLAPLTSIPNAYTAARLGIAGRGAALVSETLNSNTINLLAGVVVPALLVTVVSLTTTTKIDFAWLALMTVVSLTMLSRPGGMRRLDGALLIGAYVAYCIVEIAHT